MYSVQRYRKDEVRLTDEDKIIIKLVISGGTGGLCASELLH